MITCLIQAASATITLDDGAEITIPRRHNEPPEKTAATVASLLCVDRFDYAMTSARVSEDSDRHRPFVQWPVLAV